MERYLTVNDINEKRPFVFHGAVRNSKDMKRYVSKVKKKSENYLTEIVNAKKENIDFFVTKNKKSEQAQTMKPVTMKQVFSEEKKFFWILSTFMVFNLAIFFLTVVLNFNHKGGGVLYPCLLLAVICAAALAFSLWKPFKTGYRLDAKSDVENYYSEMFAITSNAIYVCFKDHNERTGETFYNYERCDFRNVDRIFHKKNGENSASWIELIGYNNEVLLRIDNYKLDQNMDLINELNSRLR